MDNIDHVSRAYADLEKQDKRIKQLEAEIDVLKKSEVCGEIELKSLKTENQRLREAIENLKKVELPREWNKGYSIGQGKLKNMYDKENQRLKEAIKNGVQELRDADVWWADNIAGNLQKALEE